MKGECSEQGIPECVDDEAQAGVYAEVPPEVLIPYYVHTYLSTVLGV